MAISMDNAVARAIECVNRNTNSGVADVEAICQWAVGAAFRYVLGQPEPSGVKELEMIPLSNADKERKDFLSKQAKAAGLTGHFCPDCGNCTMVQNGTCLKCTTCGSTTGCS